MVAQEIPARSAGHARSEIKGELMRELLERATRFEPELIALRRHFHQHPELSFQEQRTSEEVANRVAALGYSVRKHVGLTGVIAELDNGSGPCVALRADM